MSLQQEALSSFDQASVEKWLQMPENQSFTNNFLLNWVKQHPELHKDILLKVQCGEKVTSKSQLPHQLCQQHRVPSKKTCSTFLPIVSDTILSIEKATNEGSHDRKIKSISTSVLPHSSKESVFSSDSGVESMKSCNMKEKSKALAIAVKPDKIGEQEHMVLQKRIKQLEGLLELVVAVLDNLTNPQYALTKILSYTKQLVACIKCRFLLLEDKLNNPSLASGNTPKFIRAFETASEKSDVEFLDGKKVDIRKLTGINVAIDCVKKGHLFIHDTTNDMLCYPLFGVEGQIIGVVQLFGDSLKSLDLDFVEQLALISGLVVDNSLSFSMLRKATKKLLCVSTRLEPITPSPVRNTESPISVLPPTPSGASTPKREKTIACAPKKEQATIITQKRECETTPVKNEPKPQMVSTVKEDIESMATPHGGQETTADEKSPSTSVRKELTKTNNDSLNQSESTLVSEESIQPQPVDTLECDTQDSPIKAQSAGDKPQKKKKKLHKRLRVFKAPLKALKKLMHRA